MKNTNIFDKKSEVYFLQTKNIVPVTEKRSKWIATITETTGLQAAKRGFAVIILCKYTMNFGVK